jgi:hypothetical protein
MMKRFIEMIIIRALLTVVLIIASPAILFDLWRKTHE